MSETLDVVIIGAGFAGLAAAKQLSALGIDNFKILEARDRVGGRTKPGEIAGHTIDLGGMWLGPTQLHLKSLAEQYQVRTYPTWLDGKGIFKLGGKYAEGEREKLDALFGPLETLDYLNVSRKLNALVRSINCEAPWDHERAKELDSMTVHDWISRNAKTEKLRHLFRFVSGAVFCAEPEQMSMLFFVHYIASGDDLDTLLSADSGGAQNFLFHGGVHQIAVKMSEELGERLHLNEAVSQIDWADDYADITTSQGQYKARKVIIAVPLPLVTAVAFDPPLPAAKMALHKQMNMGSVIKIWVAYDRPFWREQGFNGSIVREDSPVSPVFDVTPEDSKIGLISGFFDADNAIENSDLSQDERKQIVIDMLVENFGTEARSPIAYQDNVWTNEQWSGGCYGAYAPPGVYARYGEWLRKVIGPLHWAGTETSPKWTGYIDGAIQSGGRAAKEVSKHLAL